MVWATMSSNVPFTAGNSCSRPVERSHLTDQREFYQWLDYSGDVDLRKKLKQWEDYYNFLRPHAGLLGKTPYEQLKQRMLG